MQIEMIVAAATNTVIGCNNELPWKLSGDMKHFRETTTGHPIIMGRKTYESIGRPLPNRTNIVLTTDPEFKAEDVVVCNQIDHAVEAAHLACIELKVDKVFIIGGAQIYSSFFDRADTINMTRVCVEPVGDTFFPNLLESEWDEQVRTPKFRENGIGYYFTKYHRVKR